MRRAKVPKGETNNGVQRKRHKIAERETGTKRSVRSVSLSICFRTKA